MSSIRKVSTLIIFVLCVCATLSGCKVMESDIDNVINDKEYYLRCFVSYNNEPEFAKGEVGNINAINLLKDIPVQFEIYLDGKDKKIYESYVYNGDVNNERLLWDLDAGQYVCYVRIKAEAEGKAAIYYPKDKITITVR